MNAIKRKINIPKNRIINLRVPDTVPINEYVEVIMIFDENKNSYQSKIELMSNAKNDKSFMEDFKKIEEDFKSIDSEGWE
ncbi:MAG: hypothetical protein M1419_09035 [Bacteroidetes bacterium]|nr:hypothetical protein [Bacteroidota bacterium]